MESCVWAGLLGCWAAGLLGCMSNPETEIGLFENETEVGLFENGKLRLHRKKSFRMANSNKQFLFISFLRV